MALGVDLHCSYRYNSRQVFLCCLVCMYHVSVLLKALFSSDERPLLETFQNSFFSCVEHNKKHIFSILEPRWSGVSSITQQKFSMHATYEAEGTSKHLLNQRAGDVNLHAFSEFLLQSFVFIFIFRSYSLLLYHSECLDMASDVTAVTSL